MSEIPKLERTHCLNASIGKMEYHYSEQSLKEVNDFWDKYKDNPSDFLMDFPEYETFFLKEFFLSKTDDRIYKSYGFYPDYLLWLHDLLYKVELC